ncbi:MAG TPA: hypothetical protein VHC43_17510 [Mycobacteriales bacterium]|nr:hypothetical protein [Mycobacteriales bacterium]
MSGRDSVIGAALAVVLVVGIVDAAAGHKGSSKSSSSIAPTATSAPTSPVAPTPTPTPTRPATHNHRHRQGGTPTSSIPTTAPAPTVTSTSGNGTGKTGGNHSAAPTSSPSTPPGVLGTFTYATTGGEQTSIPGTSRSFPKTTTITNKLQGCGVASTWKPIPEHVQKQLLCPVSDGIKIKSYETTITFYGVSSGEDFKCSGPSYIDRRSLAPGDTWKFTCKSADATAVQKARVIGFEKIDVGSESVRTLHLHIVSSLTGSDSGTSTQDYWIDTQKPVMVKETGKVEAHQQNVTYTSTYSLALTSLSPKT